MNPRRVHELMRGHFPAFDTAQLEWVNMYDGSAPRVVALDELLRRNIEASEVLVQVHRKLGALLPTVEAAAYVGAHIGEGEIRVADRGFTSFVVVAINGVAAGWRLTDNTSIESGAPAASAHFQR